MAEPQTLPTTLVEWLDDLTVRFLLNLPAEELSSVPRLCFQVEEAQWFYEDFVRPAVAASGATPLPSLNLRQFCLLLFQHCPLLSGFTDAQHLAAYEEFLAYKVRVPVRGAIMLNEDMEKVVLVRGWKKGSSWSFPRGKINKDEKDLDCAIREVWEETGYDVREAGLVPEDEDEVKHIDITMREQHMRLFIFRGVPEDTYFEPQTRKEISKILWYSIRDLPGFKRNGKQAQATVQAGEAAAASKFYMVAPFLGRINQWVKEQKKKDKSQAQRGAMNGNATQFSADEDSAAPQDPAEEMKKLLSIGGSAPAIPIASKPPVAPDSSREGHANGLLAMLREGSGAANGAGQPATPFEQVDAVPPEPETPQPHHPRQPHVGQPMGPPPPQFPLSPPNVQQQQQQRNMSLPTPGIFGPTGGPPGFPHHQQPQPGFRGMQGPAQIPPHIQQQQQQQQQNRQFQHQYQHVQGLPAAPQGPLFANQNQIPPNGHSRAPFQGAPMPPQQMQQLPRFDQPPQAGPMMGQGPPGVVGSGPAAPNASQLPAPKMNAHSTKLLEAFKSGGNQAKAASAVNQPQKPAGAHQAALLDLFRKPSNTAQAPPAPSTAISQQPPEQAVSPTLTDVTIKPAKQQERRTTLNEFTRTLPGKPKAKSPAAPEAPEPTQPPIKQPPPRAATSEEQSIKLQQQTPRQVPVREPRQPPPTTRAEPNKQPSNFANVRPPKPASRSPGPKQAQGPKQAGGSNAPRKQATTNSAQQNATSPAPFSILPRPGSSKGSRSPAPPASPLRNETTPKPAFQPQVLKRPKVAEAEPQQAAPVEPEAQPGDKKDQLLALFGKPAPVSPTPSAASVPTQHPAPQDDTRKTNLLNLFNSSQQPTPTQTPPPAPRIAPERKPSSQHTQQAAPQPVDPRQDQQRRLQVHHQPSGANTPLASPSTPISPFALGTPVGARRPPGGFVDGGAAETRSRFGSMASQGSAGSAEGGGRDANGGRSTPTEAKDFLMGYLNGLVKKEGYKGEGKRG